MKPYKVVYNACFGGFSLSEEAMARLRKLGADIGSEYMTDPLPRHDPRLVRVIEELGEAAGGRFAKLSIREISEPYRITEYDGFESVEVPSDIEWITPETAR